MTPDFNERLDAIPWSNYQTAYGPAIRVPEQLRQLAGLDEKAALDASNELWAGLCHQYAAVSSAALPALPFILEIMDQAGEQLTIEILDILCGFAYCTSPRSKDSSLEWKISLRAGVAAERPRFERLAAHPNDEIAHLANKILRNLDLG